jgi:endonuclease/exonuclease/phosphatase family metal-dependent hydrolase
MKSYYKFLKLYYIQLDRNIEKLNKFLKYFKSCLYNINYQNNINDIIKVKKDIENKQNQLIKKKIKLKNEIKKIRNNLKLDYKPKKLLNKKIGLDFDGIFHNSVYYSDSSNGIINGQGYPNKIINKENRFKFILDDKDIMDNDLYIISANHKNNINKILNIISENFDSSKITYNTFDKYDKIVELNLDEFYDDSLIIIIQILEKNKTENKLKKDFKLFWVLPLGFKPYIGNHLYLPNNIIEDDDHFKIEVPLIDFYSKNINDIAKKIILFAFKQFLIQKNKLPIYVYSWNLSHVISKDKKIEDKLIEELNSSFDIFAFQEPYNKKFGDNVFENKVSDNLTIKNFRMWSQNCNICQKQTVDFNFYNTKLYDNPKYHKFYTIFYTKDHYKNHNIITANMITYINYDKFYAIWIQAGIIESVDDIENGRPYHAILLTDIKTKKQFIFINRHMPHKYVNKISKFQELLDNLKQKYGLLDIIIAGDFNDEDDKLYNSIFKFNDKILKSNNIPPITCCGNKYNGIDNYFTLKSCDYVISNKPTFNTYPSFDEKTYYKLSDHLPILGIIKL